MIKLIPIGLGIIGAILTSLIAIKIDKEKSLKWAFLGAYLSSVIGFIMGMIIILIN